MQPQVKPFLPLGILSNSVYLTIKQGHNEINIESESSGVDLEEEDDD